MATLRGIATISRPDPFAGLALACSIVVMLFILLPLMEMILQPSTGDMADALKDGDVLNAIGLSIGTALCAGLIALVLGTPFPLTWRSLLVGIIMCMAPVWVTDTPTPLPALSAAWLTMAYSVKLPFAPRL